MGSAAVSGRGGPGAGGLVDPAPRGSRGWAASLVWVLTPREERSSGADWVSKAHKFEQPGAVLDRPSVAVRFRLGQPLAGRSGRHAARGQFARRSAPPIQLAMSESVRDATLSRSARSGVFKGADRPQRLHNHSSSSTPRISTQVRLPRAPVMIARLWPNHSTEPQAGQWALTRRRASAKYRLLGSGSRPLGLPVRDHWLARIACPSVIRPNSGQTFVYPAQFPAPRVSRERLRDRSRRDGCRGRAPSGGDDR